VFSPVVRWVGSYLNRVGWSVQALQMCSYGVRAVIPHDALLRISDAHPRLARLLWLTTLAETSAHRQRLAITRLPAPAHMAHLFCELFVRRKAVGLTKGNSYPLPVTQMIIGQTVGLSSVHVNRTVRSDGIKLCSDAPGLPI
jgi:CRP-like cAMP-binding protein